MKKIIIPILIFLFAFNVLAKTADLPDSGLTPDSPLYFLKEWKESIQTFFTFGEENKAKQYLHLAGVRLAEYQKMIEKGKTEIAQKTLEKYENQISRVLDKAKEIKGKGQDIKDLSQKIEETVGKHLEVLQENIQKVPEQAKKGIENAIENSQKKVEEITGKKDGQTVTIQDLVNYPDRFLGKKVRVSGKLVLTSETYFPNPEVGISDGINTFPVNPWLPTEIPPIPPGSGGSNTNEPSTMAYYLDKNFILQGTIKSGEIYPKKGAIIYLDVSGVE